MAKIDVDALKNFHENVYSDLVEFFHENNEGEDADVLIAELSPMEAFDTFLSWNGLIGFRSMISDAIYACVSSSDEYIIKTDGERDGWFEEMVGATA